MTVEELILMNAQWDMRTTLRFADCEKVYQQKVMDILMGHEVRNREVEHFGGNVIVLREEQA